MVHTLTQSHTDRGVHHCVVRSLSEAVGFATTTTTETNTRRYAFSGEDHILYPVAFETLGVLGLQANKLHFELEDGWAASMGDSRAGIFTCQRLSLDVQSRHAAFVLSTVGRWAALD